LPIAAYDSVSSFTKLQKLQPRRRIRLFHYTRAAMAKEYKLKGLSGLSLGKGEKQEFEVEGIEDGKILLVNQDGQFHALSPKCTHYGAPLVKGVLHDGGRITCPWHGGEQKYRCLTHRSLTLL
jgi:nitrite reductase/ring-hydroxylating ferredoxin subunit